MKNSLLSKGNKLKNFKLYAELNIIFFFEDIRVDLLDNRVRIRIVPQRVPLCPHFISVFQLRSVPLPSTQKHWRLANLLQEKEF